MNTVSDAVPASFSDWRVYVLCAQWCGTCRAYEAVARTLAQQGLARWVWVDIEAHADLLGDLDVENFPSLLIAQGTQLRFMGTVTPQPAVAQRLLQSLKAGGHGTVPDFPDANRLLQVLADLPALD